VKLHLLSEAGLAVFLPAPVGCKLVGALKPEQRLMHMACIDVSEIAAIYKPETDLVRLRIIFMPSSRKIKS
jgi:hypothetical protein